MTDRVILWCPAGRRANMELLLPFLRRILDENPQTQLDVWNLARDPADNEWLRTLKGERMHVINRLYGMHERDAFVAVYSHYARAAYADALFVKVDDDVVFIQTDYFATFLATIETFGGSVISADVINNGACALLHPPLCAQFPEMTSIPLEAYQSAEFATESHAYFQDNWPDLINRRLSLHSTDQWCSINLIGYNWKMGCRIVAGLGTKPPKVIAARPTTQKRMGDEGMVNTLPRGILQGFTAAHLSYGPQHKLLPESYWQAVREQYRLIGKQYLEAP